jgi:branched-chain amino acid aminotransferase
VAECINQYFITNGQVKDCNQFTLPKSNDFVLYEVLRVINGKPVFVEDHVERLLNSAKVKRVSEFLSYEGVLRDIQVLISANSNVDGNIKIEYYFTKQACETYFYYIQHFYPSAEMYVDGIATVSHKVVRPNPNVKQLHSNIKVEIDNLFKNNDIYEVLLVNEAGLITEGSKSNVFFIKQNCLYTAPDNIVLLGITRKYVIKAINNLRLELKFDAVSIEKIKFFDSVFLCGTSPKVLPISQIDNFTFDTSNKVFELIKNEYDKIITNFITG